MKKSKGKVEREYGPFPGAKNVGGVTYDGKYVWAALGDQLNGFDSATGQVQRSLKLSAHAGTAFDGRYLYQIAESRIQKIDPDTGKVVSTIPAPGNGGDSGMAWAEGSLWVGEHRARKIHQIDPDSGKILRTIESNRFVTGVTWIGDELWHATWEGEVSELRHVDAKSGAILESVELPAGINVSGLEFDGKDTFYCGGGGSGKVRAIRKT